MADPGQPRKQFDHEQLERLAESIRSKGQIHPIHVRWAPAHERWLIISGERRYRAALMAGLAIVECQFSDAELSESEILELQLVENLLRAELKPVEEAEAFQQLQALTGWNNKELAAAIHVTPSKVTRSLALLKLAPEIRQQVARGELAARTAYELTKLSSDEQRQSILAKSSDSDEKLTVTKVQNQVRQRKGKGSVVIDRGNRKTFVTETSWTITASTKTASTYEEMAQAFEEALEEIRHRIDSNIQL
ncbi:UNVERIFIED_CONTAM: hypothetical protein GTU68_044849 [Idotea baltica]|nr:hypothetical protein [Idotea baltica]